MNELYQKSVLAALGMWRFRVIAAITAWVVALVGWSAIYVLPDVYEARAKVFVDTDTILKPLLQGIAIQWDVGTQVKTLSTILLNRPTLQAVATQNGLFGEAHGLVDQEEFLAALKKRIEVTNASANVFEITFKDENPQKAHKVVRSLLDTFIENALGNKRSDNGVAQRFIKEQLDEYGKKLTESEQRLADYKKRNVGALPGQGGDYYARLGEHSTTLDGLRSHVRQLTDRRAELQRQIEGEEPTLGMIAEPEASALDGQISQLRARRDQLLVQYTEKHPEVVAIDETIARLEAQKREDAKHAHRITGGQVVTTAGLAAKVLDINPVYQSMKISLSQTDAQIAELKGQIAEEERQVSALKARVDSVPQVEAELVRLQRDHDVNKREYDELLQRYESAKISENAEKNTENVKFRIVDPPTVPLVPVAPHRTLLLTLVLVLSLVVGVGVAFALHEMRPVYFTRRELRQETGHAVFGVVSELPSAELVRWHRRASYWIGGAAALLVVCYGANVLLIDRVRALVIGPVG